jgi:hypothetical protein
MPKPRHDLEPLIEEWKQRYETARLAHEESRAENPQYDLLCSVQDIRDTVRAQRVLIDKLEKQLVALIDEIRGN